MKVARRTLSPRRAPPRREMVTRPIHLTRPQTTRRAKHASVAISMAEWLDSDPGLTPPPGREELKEGEEEVVEEEEGEKTFLAKSA